MSPNKGVLRLTKVQGATRQTNAAIEAFARGDFDIAITLAGAAEGMIKWKGRHLFTFLRGLARSSACWKEHLDCNVECGKGLAETPKRVTSFAIGTRARGNHDRASRQQVSKMVASNEGI